ncbi:hypothetical protein A2642_05140 [Candidatus Nomurabacteria bacterium RIFCSPHIGHO2_01_FULL_39_10]|uniref:Uncharacterized protein n=1 Tax=Candidatus Nomurabacteria bacterium RIFCSPHIGHO2_01_FULL_39_10 TaxID=1801733 RepID=A0A1F6V7S4_9BACT|nr:MAG: hypothetical protein A2642_05140 [Candidatus Nomurabacteria bacterium RIFCSPHIGHO2_01_FULL_39_10]
MEEFKQSGQNIEKELTEQHGESLKRFFQSLKNKKPFYPFGELNYSDGKGKDITLLKITEGRIMPSKVIVASANVSPNQTEKIVKISAHFKGGIIMNLTGNALENYLNFKNKSASS